jgi:hypothetical protein
MDTSGAMVLCPCWVGLQYPLNSGYKQCCLPMTKINHKKNRELLWIGTIHQAQKPECFHLENEHGDVWSQNEPMRETHTFDKGVGQGAARAIPFFGRWIRDHSGWKCCRLWLGWIGRKMLDVTSHGTPSQPSGKHVAVENPRSKLMWIFIAGKIIYINGRCSSKPRFTGKPAACRFWSRAWPEPSHLGR